MRRWEAGERAIPTDVDDLLEEIEEQTSIILWSALEGLTEVIDQVGEQPDGIDLTAYADDAHLWAAHPDFAPLSASWHRAMLARLAERCEVPVRFHFPQA